MTTAQAVLAFTAAASLLTITPGVDTALVIRTAVAGGPRQAALAALGIALGCLGWAALVSVGLGALLAASELAFTLVKGAGAAYLVWLGLRLLLKPRTTLAPGGQAAGRGGFEGLGRGFLTNMLNPKVGVFYVTFLPQFVPESASVASFSFLLAAIHVALGLLWFAVLIAAMIPMSRFLSRPAVVRTLDRACGLVFLGFGLKLALARR